jgi:hypothetical protein
MNSLEQMHLFLTGLSGSDLLGETVFGAGLELATRIEPRQVPPAPWRYADVP